MKAIILTLPALALFAACTPTLPDVPPNSRPVVGPSGTSEAVKPWNQVTKQESDAVLPFNNMRR